MWNAQCVASLKGAVGGQCSSEFFSDNKTVVFKQNNEIIGIYWLGYEINDIYGTRLTKLAEIFWMCQAESLHNTVPCMPAGGL